MKTIILTAHVKHDTARKHPLRFLIELDELTGEATIVNETAARLERDRSVDEPIKVGAIKSSFSLAVEVAP